MPTNRTASASNVREARQALGLRLRELRRNANLTGRQLAESMAWPPSKVSKLENGRQTPTEADIRGWTATTGSEAEAEALLASLHTLELKHAEWQRQFNLGLHPHQDEIAELLAGQDNGDAGNLQGQFFTLNRILDGPDDGFWVDIVS